jgi:esterase/lipase superfamily enzyme
VKRQTYSNYSEALGVEMPVVRLGDWGPALIYVPSSGGDETEFERYGMPEDCADWIHPGRAQVFSIDGFGPRGLFNDALEPADRMGCYARFERYLADELVPWVLSVAQNEYLGIVGSSYGAYAAANLLLKRPETVKVACGLGGVYAHWHRLDGHHDDEVYFHTPLEYLPRLEEAEILGRIRSTRGLMLYGAENDPWLESTHAMAGVLAGKNLPHEIEIWPAPADHHERWWKLQIRRFLTRYF